MAGIQLDPKSKRYRIRFRYGGQEFKRSIKTRSKKEAGAILGRVEETLILIERGRLEVPTDADPATFILSDGKQKSKPKVHQKVTLGELFDLYESNRVENAKEETTISTEQIHIAHLRKRLPMRLAAQALEFGQLQGYVTDRLQDKWHGQPIKVDTVKKELATFCTIWNWAALHKHVVGLAPTQGLQYPKRDEKPPFMTRSEIERVVARGGLTGEEEKELWNSLFLKTEEISELLQQVKNVAIQPFIYPMLVFVAHTGARRSELLRSEVDDFDFDSGMVKVREKKRSRKNAITFRHIPMTKYLRNVMSNWFEEHHPGGRYTLAQNSFDALAITRAVDHFERTLNKTSWRQIKGFHVFRHSFASNLAAGDVDQRVIDEWMGHQTDEMRRRYRHLFPDQQHAAIDAVFGSKAG